MTKRNIIILTIITSIFFSSCDKIINVDVPGGENQLVVNATLCPDSIISATICKSKNVLDKNKTEYLNSENIVVYENNILVDTLKCKGNGLYLGNVKPLINKTYTLKVAGIITATDSVPEPVKIEKVDTTNVINGKSQLLNCAVNFTDPANNVNFYILRILFADVKKPKNTQLQKYTCYDPMIMSQDITDSLAGGNILSFDDSQFNGKSHSILVSMLYPKNKIIYFQLWSISRAFYKYCYTIASNRVNNTSWLSTKIQVISNVKGGLGILAAYSISTDSIVVK
jgi:hypothetical protein